MDLFAELIGELSNIRFASVSDRFIAELEKYNNQTIMKERQGHMEMLIKGMRYLKIKVKKKKLRELFELNTNFFIRADLSC